MGGEGKGIARRKRWHKSGRVYEKGYIDLLEEGETLDSGSGGRED